MSQLGVKPSQTGALARLLAETVKGLNVHVSASQDIGGEFRDQDLCDAHFEHTECYSTVPGKEDEMWTLTEKVEDICGAGSVVLKYDYGCPTFSSTEKGQIRLVMPNKRHYLKYYGATGTFAFRLDSVLSHVSIMHGAFPESPYSLKPGQLLPAQHTDEGVKGGLYFYGSLFACPKTGQGKLKLQDAAGKIDQQVQAVCDLGIISILRVTRVMAGPKSKSETQWAKSGSPPTCAYVVGAIVSKHQNDALFQLTDLPNKSKFMSFAKSMREVVAMPSKFLPLESLDFLKHYVAGGVFLAHANWLPLRCIIPYRKEEATKTDEWIAGERIKSRVAEFIRDKSFEDARNQEVKRALMDWVRRGLRQEKVVLDPSTNLCGEVIFK